AGLRGGGPEAVVTDKCVFRFHPETKEMILSEISENSQIEEIRALVGWPLKVSREVKIMEPPTQEQMEIMNRYDPLGLVLGSSDELDLDDFDAYVRAMERI
ncbi:MAG: glutaconate CoA-transferase, partial [Deltaproteobacteria bacterium]